MFRIGRLVIHHRMQPINILQMSTN